MRVCMVGYTFYQSDNRVRRYAEALSRNGHDVEAIVLRRPSDTRQSVVSGVRVLRIQQRVRNERSPVSYLFKMLAFVLRSMWTLSVRHARQPYDVIHIHSVPDFEVFAALLPRMFGARIILDIHDIVPEFYASKFRVSHNSAVYRILRWVEMASVGFSHHVIIANHLWREKLIQRSVSSERCTAIINYPDTEIFFRRTQLEPTGGDFTICYPGTLNWHQGVDLAVQAVDILRERLPQLRFVIVGDGPGRDDLYRMIEERKLRKFVTLSDPVPLEDVAALMARVDLGVVPKRRDSFGNEAFSTKIMEFMAMGVPVVAARTAIDEFYFDESMIEFFESGNAEDLAAKILYLAESRDARDRLCANADRFIQKNSWAEKQEEYLNLLQQLTGKSAGHSVIPTLVVESPDVASPARTK